MRQIVYNGRRFFPLITAFLIPVAFLVPAALNRRVYIRGSTFPLSGLVVFRVAFHVARPPLSALPYVGNFVHHRLQALPKIDIYFTFRWLLLLPDGSVRLG